MADTREVDVLYDMRRDRLKYEFKPYIWQVGGKFVYPDNKDDRHFMFERGFEHAMEEEPNVYFKSFL